MIRWNRGIGKSNRLIKGFFDPVFTKATDNIVPDVPNVSGLEYTLGISKLHFNLEDSKLHYILIKED